MRVLFITRKWSPAVGGMETYAVKYAEYVSKKAQLTVLHPAQCKTGRTNVKALCGFVVNVLHHLIDSKPYNCYQLGDGVLYPLAFFIYALTGKKSSVIFHGLDIKLATNRSVLGYIYRAYMSLLKFAPISIATPNSEYTASMLRLYHLNIRTIPLASDMAWTSTKRTNTKTHIVFVGRVIERKGALWFADKVMPRLNNCIFEVVGPADRTTREKLARYPNVIFHGQLTDGDMHLVRCRADIFVVPNIKTPVGDSEGFGLVCVENSRYGVPVLASNWQGLTSAVLDGKTGYLLSPEEPKAWVEMIEKIQSWSPEQRDAWADLASKWTLFFTWERVAIQFLTAYLEQDNKDSNEASTPIV